MNGIGSGWYVLKDSEGMYLGIGRYTRVSSIKHARQYSSASGAGIGRSVSANYDSSVRDMKITEIEITTAMRLGLKCPFWRGSKHEAMWNAILAVYPSLRPKSA